jgi:hypothetical protein
MEALGKALEGIEAERVHMTEKASEARLAIKLPPDLAAKLSEEAIAFFNSLAARPLNPCKVTSLCRIWGGGKWLIKRISMASR